MFSFKNTISYIKPIVMKYKWQFYLIFLISAGRTLISIVTIPIFYKKIIDLVSNSSSREMVAESLYYYVVLISVAFIASWVFSRSAQFAVSKFQSSVIKDLHDFSFNKLQGHSYSFFADSFSGALVNKSRKFVRAFEIMHDILIDNFWQCFVAFVSMFLVFFFQARLISLIFFLMSIVYVFVIFLMSRKKVQYDVAEAAADSKVTAYLADSITNILAIKASSSFPREMSGFQEVTREESGLRLRAWYFGNKINAIQAVILIIVQISATFITAKLWLAGEISAGMFLLVQSYMVMISGLFWDLGRAMTKFTKALSDMKEMVDIFKKIPDVLDVVNPEKSRIHEGAIEINNMFFNYSGSGDVFNHFSLKINSGEKVGLVGHSGSGKSTITKLIMRFIDISAGEILIDGQNISKITQDDLRKSISYISQEPILFHRTIKENIAYSYPEATDEEIIQAAKKAHAHEFISNLRLGYETLVGERGVKLSGGERQRVAIARAMLKPAPIIIMDEATSSLDSISESYIQDALTDLTKGKTTLVIAHRLSTIQKMDRIIVLEKGKIVETGTHQELLKIPNGFYADLWNHQTGGFL